MPARKPSGIAQWPEDERPRELLTACRPLGIVVLDHVIVAENGHFSFADNGLLDEES